MLRKFTAAAALLFTLLPAARAHAQNEHAGHNMAEMGGDPAKWRMPPMNMNMAMMMMSGDPKATAWLPGRGVDPSKVAAARPRETIDARSGDTLTLATTLVKRTINGRTYMMYGFNGQYPGPLIRVPQNANVTVKFENRIDMPTAVHWHGIRLDNASDGVPGITQKEIETNGSFVYKLRFPDPGVYWYHPHHREDIQQDLGLYGNIFVVPSDPNYFAPANREEFLMIDDVLIDEAGLFPYGEETPSHALMGRFGNTFLVNGDPNYKLDVKKGDVVRFFITNASNTRTYNLSFGKARIKLVGADGGRFEKESWVPSVVIAPAERYIVDVKFDESGPVAISNRIQAIDHMLGEFYAHTDTLGTVNVAAQATDKDNSATFATLREDKVFQAEAQKLRARAAGAPARELSLGLKILDLPVPTLQLLSVDTMYSPPVEWNDAMPDMNYAASGKQVTWFLKDVPTGKLNEAIDNWSFGQGDFVKLRIFNDPRTYHPMQHPIHLHGQRFLVLSRDGIAVDNMAWKDTVIVPVGGAVEVLVDMSNPGDWMLHCHISEHMHSGMMMKFKVGAGGSQSTQ